MDKTVGNDTFWRTMPFSGHSKKTGQREGLDTSVLSSMTNYGFQK